MKWFKVVLYIMFLLLGILILGSIERTAASLIFYSITIVVGALIIAWAAESSEIMISEGLALAFVAWLQVFPEFIIEATIAWAKDIPNIFSNFTGANRILVGIGWPLVFLTASFFNKRRHGRFLKEIKLGREHGAEVIFFLAATVYSFLIYFRGSLNLFDSFVMGGLYISYLYFVSKLPHTSRKKSKKFAGRVAKMVLSLKKNWIMPVTVLMFILGGVMIYLVAEPFYNNALILATSIGVSQFLFIQWIAPFLSEFPEKTSAFYWASKIKKAPMALMNLISSKLAQWTILMAMIPIVFSISSAAISSIPLNSVIENTNFTVATELLLTIASSLYASIFLLKLRFTWLEAISLFALWIIQFIWVASRPALIWVYFGLAALELVIYRKEVKKAFLGFKHIYYKHVRNTSVALDA